MQKLILVVGFILLFLTGCSRTQTSYDVLLVASPEGVVHESAFGRVYLKASGLPKDDFQMWAQACTSTIIAANEIWVAVETPTPTGGTANVGFYVGKAVRAQLGFAPTIMAAEGLRDSSDLKTGLPEQLNVGCLGSGDDIPTPLDLPVGVSIFSVGSDSKSGIVRIGIGGLAQRSGSVLKNQQ